MRPGLREHIERDITKLGFTTIAVGDDPAGWFAYTVGLTELGHPEILISGLRGDYCHGVFWNAYNAIKKGHSFKAGQEDDTLGHLTCAFKTLSPEAAEKFCRQALYFYEDKPKTPTFVQLVMPDKAGRLPWQPGYDAQLMKVQRHLWVQLH
jgi:hypothetical protein